MDLLSEVKTIQRHLERLILATPTGVVRNELTTANIALMQIIAFLKGDQAIRVSGRGNDDPDPA